MATNVKLKIRGASSWTQVYPETNLDQLSDATTAGRALAKLTTPASDSFIKITTAGAVSYRTIAQVQSDLGVSLSGHTHDYENITGLTSYMAGFAQLDSNSGNGKLISSVIPSWILGGLRCAGSISSATLTIDTTFRTTYGMLDAATNNGLYIVSTNAGCVVTLAANHVLMVGDEGDTVSTVTLESGDMIVYRGYSNPNYQFDIFNNANQQADLGVPGIGSLSPGVANRGLLASSANGLKIIDEAALRQVMRSIYYEDAEGSVTTPVSGDVLFEY